MNTEPNPGLNPEQIPNNPEAQAGQMSDAEILQGLRKRQDELGKELADLDSKIDELISKRDSIADEKNKIDDQLLEITESKKQATLAGTVSNPGSNQPKRFATRNDEEAKDAERKEKRQSKIRKIAAVAGVVVVAGLVALGVKSCDNNDKKSERVAPTDNVPAKGATTSTGAATTATTAGRSLDKVSYKELVSKYGRQDRGSDAEHLIGNIGIDPNNEKASYNRLMREINQNPQALAHLNTHINPDGSFNTERSAEENARLATIRLAKYEKMPLAERAKIAKSLNNKFSEHIKFNGIVTHNGLYNTFGTDGQKIFAMQNTRYNDYWLSFTDENGNKFYVRDCAQVVSPVKVTPKKTTTVSGKPTGTTPTKPTVPVAVSGKPTPANPKPEKPTKPTPKPEKPTGPTCETNPEMEGCAPKTDRNTTPAGVPGQNGGSGTSESGPTGPGTGPAEQPVNPNGTVGGEKLPQAPAPEAPKPEQTPLPNQPSAPVQPGEQTGQKTEAPAENATGPAGTGNASTDTKPPILP